MKVLKFGGTSVGSSEAIKKVLGIVLEQIKTQKLVVVVSALGGTTDKLLNAGNAASTGDEMYKETIQHIGQRHLEMVKELLPVQTQSSALSQVKKTCNDMEDLCNGIFLLGELSARTKDKLVSYGEVLSSQIIAAAFRASNINVAWKDSREFIKTNSNFTHAQVNFDSTNKLVQEYFASNDADVVLLPGFISSDANNANTTLGRGGSDYTAAIVAAALDAASVEIWTDVSGMMTADPRFVQNVKVIPSISYQEAMELSHFGAKVIYPPTIQPVLSKGIPVWVKNTFAPTDEGTIIETNAAASEHLIRGITSINNMALISLEGSGMIGVPGFSKRLFESLSNDGINVILITQGSSEHSICVGVEAAAAIKAKATVDLAFANEIALQKVEPLIVETDLSIIALVGENMKSHQGISGKMFGVLGRNGVNIRAIAQGSSERNISAVIATKDVRKAVNVLHEEFFETTYKQLNLFIAGVGNVGGKLVEQLRQQQQYLKEHLQLQVNVVGLANSKQSLINEEGIDLSNWKESLSQATSSTIHDFVQQIINRNLRNTVFADVTANGNVAKVYDQLLAKSIAVVACNKVAASSEYSYYKKLKNLAREYNTSFLFETNVGAGLPIIGTLSDLTRTGDEVHKMQAVLSGTLNFVFNNYDGSKTFAEVVKQAQDEGYTEPDPRLDLSGTDVMRKIMILAREAGHQMEMTDIANNSFMPAECMQGTVEDFYESMKKYESHFKQLLDEAKAKGCILKFVAQFHKTSSGEGGASVGLQHIDPQHNLYHLYGKDNIVLFYTDRYIDQPLVIKGAGAGAAVTASGVFADIMRAV
ncbi:MAG: bifunctional aspartate kinase/homoserine dehydrogenase I [Chitinophagaceae bacterium]|nr:bifunctional aspartate kinase/homoserine dehydrogenase I [Chitinophagaceae bacterium]